MNTIILVLSIFILIINIIIICINFKLIKTLESNNITENLSETTKNNEKINLDETLNSLEFNTHLDELIRPLLGKYNNKDIVDKVSEYVLKNDLKNADEDKIKNYISDVLLVYNNHIEQPETESVYPTEEVIDYHTDDHSSISVNTDVARALNNFYR